MISSSLSQIIRSATDCTRPALKPLFTFTQRSGLIVYPTIRSSILRACCASTRFISRSRGCLMEFFTAVFVISLKEILRILDGSSFSACIRCQEIASPSRSGSVARYILSAFLAALRRFESNSPFPLIVIYFGSKSFSTSIPN